MTDNVVPLFPNKPEEEVYDVVRIRMMSDGSISLWVVNEGMVNAAQFLWAQENLSSVGNSLQELRRETLGKLK